MPPASSDKIWIWHARSNMKNYSSTKQLKAYVRQALLGHYGTLIFSYLGIQCITSLALSFVQEQISSATGQLLYWGVNLLIILLMGVFSVGQFYMYRKLLGGEEIALKDMWFGFRYHPDKAIVISLISFILYMIASIPFLICCALYAAGGKQAIVFMFAMFALALFLITSIVISLCLSQALFLLLDYPGESALALCKHSNDLMKGHKMRLFLLYLSFIGMFVLVILTCGIGMLWVYPYFTGAKARFYDELVDE